jgi:serine/threonine-protein kinase
MNISVQGESAPGDAEPTTHAAYEDYLAGIGYFQRYDRPGNIELAITSLQKALKTDPNFALGYARLAQIYTSKYLMSSDSRWLQLAEENGKRAVRLDDRIPATYVALGQVHELTGNHDLAIQEFQRAISLDARDAEALSGIANAYKNAGRNEDAEAFYIKAAALRPNDWKGYNDLGNFYEDIGRPRDAITQFNRSLALTPDNAWSYANLALAYMDFDDPEMLNKAEKALKRSIELSPTFAAYSNLGFLYMQQHRFAESVTATEQALKLNDQSYQVWDNLIAGYEWLKEKQKANTAREKAIELLERKLQLNSQDAGAQAKLSALYAKNGARERAVERINIALALSPDNQYVLSQIADAYELLGERARAIQTLQHALKSGLSRASLSEDPEIQDLIVDPRFKTPGA